LLQHTLATISRIGDHVKVPRFPVLADQTQHLDRQFGSRAVGSPLFGCPLLTQVQAKEDRQAKWPISPQRKADNHAHDDPTMAPVGDLFAAAGQQRVVMHRRAEHFEPAFACQGVVDCQEDGVLHERFDHVEHGQTKPVPRPACGSKEPMVGRIVLRSHSPRRDDHFSDRPPIGENPTGNQRHEAGKGRLGHHHGQRLQQGFERVTKVHGELPFDERGLSIPDHSS